MSEYLDERLWRTALTRPDWYLSLSDDFKRLEALAEQNKDGPDHKKIKREAYELVEESISNGSLPLASEGPDLDSERKPVDTVVIHHTNNPPGMTLERLNAMHLLRIYGRYYANPNERERNFKGKPVWSGHFYKERQVFWGYHWFIREDGSAEQLLKDSAIGWHAGNWDINTRSIGICIDDDLSRKAPNVQILDSLAWIIKSHYGSVNANNIFGHCDVNENTNCPGYLFNEAWRHKLLERLL